MADSTDGIQAMRERMSRASRKPPPPRHPPKTIAPKARAPEPARSVQDDLAVPEPTSPPQPPTPPRQKAPARSAKTTSREFVALELAPDVPPVNLAIRVRRPLDDRLAELIYLLRRRGVRTSKVELIEMLLWELPEPEKGLDTVMDRLGAFRLHAARAPGAEIPSGQKRR